MHKGRLRKMVQLLRRDAKNQEGVQFDIGTWGTIAEPRHPLSCETTACAIGLAALSRKFPGLDYEIDKRGNIQIFYDTGSNVVVGGISSACELFEIDEHQANFLFARTYGLDGMGGADVEQQVASRIEAFIEMEGNVDKLETYTFHAAKPYWRLDRP